MFCLGWKEGPGQDGHSEGLTPTPGLAFPGTSVRNLAGAGQVPGIGCKDISFEQSAEQGGSLGV